MLVVKTFLGINITSSYENGKLIQEKLIKEGKRDGRIEIDSENKVERNGVKGR